MTTYPSFFLGRIMEACRGHTINAENAHTTMTGSAAYFTDPENGQRYRISVEPIKAGQEPKFGER